MAENDHAKEDNGGFFVRWSRRKREAASESAELRPEDVQTGTPEHTAAEERDETDEEKANRQAAEAVDIETLTYESDFSVFMKSGVPEFIRRKAMRKLWSTDPLLANLDGLNDYDEDYANPRFNVFKSAWNVVGGYLGDAAQKEGDEETGEIREPAKQDEHEATKRGEAERPSEAGNEPKAVDGENDTVDAEEMPEEGEDREALPRVSLRERLKG